METTALGFDELTARDAYDAWRLRQDVFVLEQHCLYADLDGRDTEPGTRHVLLHAGDPGDRALLGYCRVLDEAEDEPQEWRIGRVVLARSARGRGLADLVVRRALEECAALDPARDVVLAAQAPLAGWYATFGFEVAGPEFLDDGIPHVPMRRRAR